MGKASTIQLTKTLIDACDPRDDRYIVWDSKLAGFGIRIEKTGRKTFIIRYRAEGGGRTAPRRFMTVGQFGTLTVEEARKKARQLLAAATVGDDPAGDRQNKRREMRMDALVELYEEEGCFIQRGKRQGTPMKPLTKQYTVARLKHHVVPLLGHKRVSEIGSGEVERFFRDVTAGKTASDEKVGPRKRVVVRGGDGAARKVFRDLSAVFSFASRRGIVESNPCEKAVVQKTDNRRERFLTLAEVTQLGKACDDLEAEGVNAKALNITRLWALTGCRRDEIAALKWTEVDLDGGLLILDDTKTGKSLRPLALAAVALLRGLERSKDSEFVFPSDRAEDAHFQGTKKVWPAIIKKAKLPGVTPHTLRHTMGATATSTGEALALTGAILGHANMRSTMIYAHVEHDPARKAATRVARKIAAALSGAEQKTKTAKAKAANNNATVERDAAGTR